MTPERWARIRAVVEEIGTVPVPERGAMLDRACANDPELRREVEPYLAEDKTGTFIHQIIGEQAASLTDSAGRGERFGRYRLIRQIGQGGMGAVFEAVRVDDFEKTVALKIIRLGLDSDLARARFLQERQLLATLEHPYIARLLDGGESDDGSPWLVMEFVSGRPIHDYAAGLDRNARLRLFLKVCEAVGHAHRNLVIHRDLKPANILVTEAGDPKLLDFGIAKLLDPTSSNTQTAVAGMTPDYASPEQIRGERISTATDVYALGVILYELLTGRKPYTVTSATPLEMERVICTAAPTAPGLGDELDHIILMALRKEPDRRYGSVERFAEDIERYLTHLPVRARPDTLVYRVSKYFRRNWPGIAAASALALTMAVGLGINIAEQRRTARRFNQVRQLANKFLFDFHDEIVHTPGTVKAREMIVSTALEYLNSLAKDAQGDPALQWELAEAYAKVAIVQGSTVTPSLRRPADGIQSFEKAIAIERSMGERKGFTDKQQEAFVGLLCDAEIMYRALRRLDMADQVGREAVAKSGSVPAFTRMRALGELALTLGQRGDYAAGESTLESILPDARLAARAQPTLDNRRRLGAALANLGVARYRLTDFAPAKQAALEALAIFRELNIELPLDARIRHWVFLTFHYLGDIAGAGDRPSMGKFDEAADRYDEALATIEPMIAADAKDRASVNDAGLIHVRAAYSLADANPRRALPHAARAAEYLDRASPENTDTRAQPHIAAANALRALRQFGAAEAQLKQAERILASPDNDTRADLELAWARLEDGRGDREQAAARFERTLGIDEKLFAKSGTPDAAWALAGALEFYAAAAPASAQARRERILAVWEDQNRRFPRHAYIEQRVAEVKSKLVF